MLVLVKRKIQCRVRSAAALFFRSTSVHPSRPSADLKSKVLRTSHSVDGVGCGEHPKKKTALICFRDIHLLDFGVLGGFPGWSMKPNMPDIHPAVAAIWSCEICCICLNSEGVELNCLQNGRIVVEATPAPVGITSHLDVQLPGFFPRWPLDIDFRWFYCENRLSQKDHRFCKIKSCLKLAMC